jgi:hypothetical protein
VFRSMLLLYNGKMSKYGNLITFSLGIWWLCRFFSKRISLDLYTCSFFLYCQVGIHGHLTSGYGIFYLSWGHANKNLQ